MIKATEKDTINLKLHETEFQVIKECIEGRLRIANKNGLQMNTSRRIYKKIQEIEQAYNIDNQ